VVAGSAYSFKPTAADANGDTLTFNIAGTLPTWLKFSTSSGLLGGTPTAAGTAGPFTISVSDGKGGSASLPPFSISVSAPATGSATLNWTPPTQNTDGTALADLAGYRVYYGTSATTLTSRVDIAQPATTQYTVSTLATGTWYFAVSAYNLSGTESALSNVGSKTIP
jgi:hypothetical protein